MKRPALPTSVRRTLHLRRRPLAALCAFAAVLATLLALTPARVPTVTVYAARTALPAGTVLTAEHLVGVELGEAVVPEGAARAEVEVVGRTLGAPVSAGTVLTAVTVSEGERLARPGHVVVALPLADEAIARLVRPGVLLDVLDPKGEVLAAEVRVITPPDTPTGGNFGLGGAARSVLVEVPAPTAAKLASQGMTSLTVVVR